MDILNFNREQYDVNNTTTTRETYLLQGPNDVVQPFDVALVSTTSDVDIQVLFVLCVPCVLYTGTVSVRISFQGYIHNGVLL